MFEAGDFSLGIFRLVSASPSCDLFDLAKEARWRRRGGMDEERHRIYRIYMEESRGD
jgi:hypothetical protein